MGLGKSIRVPLTIRGKIGLNRGIRAPLIIKSKMGLGRDIAWVVIEEVNIIIFG